MCGGTNIANVLNPQGTVSAFAYTRNCGATTSFDVVVQMTDLDEYWWNESSEIVFRARKSDLTIHWENDKKLVIVCPECDRVEIFEKQWRDVEIVFEKQSAE